MSHPTLSGVALMKSEYTAAESLRLAEQRIDWVMSHPHTSEWLKCALSSARAREPIDVLNDLQILEILLEDRSRHLIDRSLTMTGSQSTSEDAADDNAESS
jgi:hypothetical protein